MTHPTRGRRCRLAVICASFALTPVFASAQTVADAAQAKRDTQASLDGRTCPGDPPGNLASIDCRFTPRMRLVDFVATSVTDQAIGGAAFFATFAYWQRRDPPEWGRGWDSFGRGVASRYSQNLAKGGADFLVSAALRTDPRHVTLANDAGIAHRHAPTATGRVGHALLDWLTVRRSNIDGRGRRVPNLPLWAGAAASGLVANVWKPDAQATTKAALLNASSSLTTALVSSFYTEFSPELARALGSILKRGRAPAPARRTEQP